MQYSIDRPLVLFVAVAMFLTALTVRAQTSGFHGLEASNLGFEAGDQLVRWHFRPAGATSAVVSDVRQGGARSLRIVRDDTASATTQLVNVLSGPVDGQRIQLSGYLRSSGIRSGWAGLWLEAKDSAGRTLGRGDMRTRGLHGTTPWTRYDVVLAVPMETAHLGFGATFHGVGTLWVDSLDLGAAAPDPFTVKGIVRDPDGKAVDGAHVALTRIRARHADAHAESGPDGHFTTGVWPGIYIITASAEGFSAAALRLVEIGASTTPAQHVLTLGRGGLKLHGRVTQAGGEPLPGVLVRANFATPINSHLFYTKTDPEGRYGLQVPGGIIYRVLPVDEHYQTELQTAAGKTDARADFVAERRRPAPPEVVSWIRDNAATVATVDPGTGFTDLEPLAGMIGNARIVGLGEPTHGSREVFRLKHRLFDFLIEKMGFDALVFEIGWSEAQTVDAYVRGGAVSLEAALAALDTWTLRTEETRDLIAGMRRFNAGRRRKVRFHGLEIQDPGPAARAAATYLKKVDTELATRLSELHPLLHERRARAEWLYGQLDQAAKDRLAQDLSAILETFDARASGWVERTGVPAWSLARQQVILLLQLFVLFNDPLLSYQAREMMMFSNLQWILATEGPDSRVALWMHNQHVGRRIVPGFKPLGAFIAEQHASAYLPVGLLFHEGEFLALEGTHAGRESEIRRITVGSPPADYLDATLARLGQPILALDLRRPATATVRDWLSGPRDVREAGLIFDGEKNMSFTIIPRKSFDMLLFVEKIGPLRVLRP